MTTDPAEVIELQMKMAGSGVPACSPAATPLVRAATQPGLYDPDVDHGLRWVGAGNIAAPR